jgi:hypothetical protein
MRFRKLRIAWSVGWGLVAVLLIVLWVRSLRAEDRLTGNFAGSHVFRLYSSRGCLVYYVPSPPGPPSDYFWRFTFGSEFWLQVSDSRLASAPQVHLRAPEKWVTLPYWLLVGLSAVATAGPWFRCRFSLRTLLIATTLVAVLLGLAVWAAS